MKSTVLIILMLLFVKCRDNTRPFVATDDGKIPVFDYQLIDSTVIKSISFQNKTPIVLFILDPDCIFCNAQLQSILDNDRLFKDVRIYLVGYAPLSRLKKFSWEKKLGNYSNITIGRDTAKATLKHFNLNSIPFTAIYSNGLSLKHTFNGKVDAAQILSSLQ